MRKFFWGAYSNPFYVRYMKNGKVVGERHPYQLKVCSDEWSAGKELEKLADRCDVDCDKVCLCRDGKLLGAFENPNNVKR